jgi:nucleoside-diphosphate-sugar epimerase
LFAGNVLIIGHTSSIGGYVFNAARRDGANVLGVSSRQCNFLDSDQSARFFDGLPKEQWTVLFLSVINKTVRNDFETFEQNIRLVRNFARAQNQACIAGVVYFSSVDVYGNRPELPITEKTSVRPDTWYGLAKYNCEWILGSSGDVGCPVTILRIPGIYGTGAADRSNDRSVIGRLIKSIRETRSVSIAGSGQASRDYVHVRDISEIASSLAALRYAGVVNVATGQSYSILDLAQLSGKAANLAFEIRHEPVDAAREFDLKFDNRLLLSLLPGFEFTDISAGIASCIQ